MQRTKKSKSVFLLGLNIGLAAILLRHWGPTNKTKPHSFFFFHQLLPLRFVCWGAQHRSCIQKLILFFLWLHFDDLIPVHPFHIYHQPHLSFKCAVLETEHICQGDVRLCQAILSVSFANNGRHPIREKTRMCSVSRISPNYSPRWLTLPNLARGQWPGSSRLSQSIFSKEFKTENVLQALL